MTPNDSGFLSGATATGAPLFFLENDGPLLKHTTYWSHPLAAQGVLYVTGNAGAWRLLVPQSQERLLPEMRTGRRAVIEKSIQWPKTHVDIVFDDRTSAPFCISIQPLSFDRTLVRTKSRLLVYTRLGLALELALDIRVGVKMGRIS